MASTPASKTNSDNSNCTSSSSYFQKTVCLQDWWLIKAEKEFEGKRLAVAGLTSREQQAVRVFCSAPIRKRYDVFTLETVDGVCVLIKGFINKVRTEENGFPSEVFKHFVFGFPPYWEKYAEKCLGGGCSSEDVSRSTLDGQKLSTDSGVDDFHEGRPNKNKKALSKEASTSRKKTKRKLIYESPVTQGGTEKTSSVCPESLSFKRSRSGRLLLPTLEFWRNQMAIYDADRQVTGIQEGLHGIEPSRGSRSEPQKKAKATKMNAKDSSSQFLHERLIKKMKLLHQEEMD